MNGTRMDKQVSELEFLAGLFADGRDADQWGWRVFYCGDLLLSTNGTSWTCFRGARRVSLRAFMEAWEHRR